jgi:hypothetical protein
VVVRCFLGCLLAAPSSVSHSFFQKNGGTVANSYSGVSYILGMKSSIPLISRMIIISLSRTVIVNPHTESGQNLYRQYIGKKGKAVLDARWVHECIKAGALQTFVSNFAGCKVTGSEQ